MRRLRLGIAILCVLGTVLSGLVATGSPAQAEGASQAAAACPTYHVIGVRGSGESRSGFHEMGRTVGPYAQQAAALLPSGTGYESLDYPAAPISVAYLHSWLWGILVLDQRVKAIASSCPATRIGLIGHSQGAHVINGVLVGLAPAQRKHVASVLLISDPASFGNSSYDVTVTASGQPTTRSGIGMLPFDPLPADIQAKTVDFCVVGDPVCDFPHEDHDVTIQELLSIPELEQIVRENMHVHLGYPTCCGSQSYPSIMGRDFGSRLLVPRPPPPPASSPLVTSLVGLPDGTVLVTNDTGRVYKLVGGAPVWLSSCAGGICPNPRPTTQAVINAGPAVPRNGATASDEAGNIFKFAGGAPVHLSSCAQGCGSPVPITGVSIATLDHMRPVPADGTTIVDEAGNIFKSVGGAPIHLSSCALSCGNPVPITGVSIATLDHMRPVPADGATMADESGNIFKFAGGAPILLASCAVGCGRWVPITGVSIAMLDHMRQFPADGTTIVSEPGHVFKFAGGAPLRLADCSAGCGAPVRISGASIAQLDHMRPFPADGTTVRTETSAVYKFAGGAPLGLLNCDPGCGTPVRITQWTVDAREHMRPAPADGTNLRAVENGTLFRTRGGEADLAGLCPAASGCATAVVVNQRSIDRIAHGVANRGPGYGVFARYANGADHYTTTGSVPAGYRLEGAFGLLSMTAAAGTAPLFSCRAGGDHFSSLSSDCEGQAVVGRLGWIYGSPPEGEPSAAVFRCKTGTGEHFDSLSSTCGGGENVVEGRLGYVLAYAPLTRYNSGEDHYTAVAGVPAGYQPEGTTFGMLSLVSLPGTVPVYACRAGGDAFTALSSTCEGQTVVGRLGWIYASPPEGLPSAPLFRCKTGTGEHFDSLSSTCGGGDSIVEGRLGYLLARKALSRGVRGSDHRSGAGVFPPGYRHEGTLGYLAGASEPGTTPLYACLNGSDSFTSLAADCEGRQRLEQLGWIWEQPPDGVPWLPLYRCKVTATGEHFEATAESCEGQQMQGRLGYVRLRP